jgi:uncharacterized DUF497 family protein
MHMTVGDSGEAIFFITTMRYNKTARIISLYKASVEEKKRFDEHTSFSV